MDPGALNLPQVAIEFMNRDHDEFVALRADLLRQIAGGVVDAINARLDELHQHTIRHFADEEKLMQETSFPVYPIHKGEHDNVLADMASRVAHWKQSGDLEALRHWLEDTVGDWLVAHVNSMDMVTASFAAAQRAK